MRTAWIEDWVENDNSAFRQSSPLVWVTTANDVSWAGELLPLLGVGPVVPLWVSLAVADWGVKLALALITLIPFRLIVGRMTRRVA